MYAPPLEASGVTNAIGAMVFSVLKSIALMTSDAPNLS